MPKYLDRHPTTPDMPADAVQTLKAKLAAGEPDQFGVIGRNMFVGKDVTFCLGEAPNPEALHKAHEAMGVTLGEGAVVEVESLL